MRPSTSSSQISVSSHSQNHPSSVSGTDVLSGCFACAFPFLILLLALGCQKYQRHQEQVRSKQLLEQTTTLERLLKLTHRNSIGD